MNNQLLSILIQLFSALILPIVTFILGMLTEYLGRLFWQRHQKGILVKGLIHQFEGISDLVDEYNFDFEMPKISGNELRLLGRKTIIHLEKLSSKMKIYRASVSNRRRKELLTEIQKIINLLKEEN